MKFHAIIPSNDYELAKSARRVLSAMAKEHAGYYGKPHGYRAMNHCTTDGRGDSWQLTHAGYTGDPDPVQEQKPGGTWLSCAGNLLHISVFDDLGSIEIFIDSRRHGIPCAGGAMEFLRMALPDPLPEDLNTLLYETACPEAHPLAAGLVVPGLTPEPEPPYERPDSSVPAPDFEAERMMDP